ncbi:peptidoglycan DD-metalloendopeptidase family protein [Citrobacter freundii]|jgi:murein DD-endopeptidase|uniref:Peptidoglycan DD-metalloendopeptidase family protein n=3 Tax=Enterobacteriaceae TaxID=543 RepID=A0A809G992_CITFR|nr:MULTISPECIES: peptidoglycan DD-metalloendopeptidase family protein [Enterobacteriaceae]EAA7372229.1 peptidase M23 [Salmonella enterica subsp. enterica]EAB9567126.1 peptidase M23 [Salmonella enterica subsp. enterica serovar Agona]EAS5427359.1 peptidase M23 [Salmonella enterica subsp. enterica serovar Ohio]ECC8340309.1 peptidoglycan DD-metalloendopeptidase family protein [Salmonella enterica subsp. enterica serovar Ruiru]EDQ9965294.1 peptidoglycan DD-metalloendopeptidase family protein [Salmo
MYSTDVVKDNAYVAASRAGLEKNEIAVLQRSLPPRYDLRHLKNNESLKLLLQKKAGQSRVVAYKFTSGKFNYTAYRISDKKFYNLSDTGSRAGLDYPLPVTARLSSPFNPARLNPVSGKVSPHNGIDYSMPMNTKIVSVINGKVTRAEYNSTMGYFVEVSGKDNVKTRYLHLSKILVKKGTSVSRGTAIALSGNSGRSSGPHLHYELVINNNPVNSLAFRAAGPADNNKLEQHAYAHARDYGRYLD